MWQKTVANVSKLDGTENLLDKKDVFPAAVPPSPTMTTSPPNNRYQAIPDIGFVDGFTVRYNCTQLRNKINAFINNGGMKVGEFQKKLGVSPSSYNSFMRQTGPHGGTDSATFAAAHQFFSTLEDSGLGMPKANTATTGKKCVEPNGNEKNDVSGVKLEGEDEGKVPVFDTPSDIRTKIKAHLRTENTTQAAFCRQISQCQGANATPVTSTQLSTFLKKKGPMGGNTSKAFYAAYVYFEKLRVKPGKKKSKKREEMEDQWRGEGGVNTEIDESRGVWLTMAESESARMNKYGRTELVSAGGRMQVI